MALKTFHYVLVNNALGEGTFVTKVSNESRQAWWNKDEKPLAMSKTHAEDLAFCLSINGHYAVVVKSLHNITTQRFNTEGI